jgi:hypothetical protein
MTTNSREEDKRRGHPTPKDLPLMSFILERYGFAAWLAPGWIATFLVYLKLHGSSWAFLVDESHKLKFVLIIPLALVSWVVLAYFWWLILDRVLRAIGRFGD